MPRTPSPEPAVPFDLTRWRAESMRALLEAARQLASIRRTLEAVEAALRHVGPVLLASAVLAGVG